MWRPSGTRIRSARDPSTPPLPCSAASAPLLSDPVEMPVTALEKLVVTSYVPGSIMRGGHSVYQYVAGQPGDQPGRTKPTTREMPYGCFAL